MNTQSSLHAYPVGAAAQGSLTQGLVASAGRVGSSPAVAVGKEGFVHSLPAAPLLVSRDMTRTARALAHKRDRA